MSEATRAELLDLFLLKLYH